MCIYTVLYIVMYIYVYQYDILPWCYPYIKSTRIGAAANTDMVTLCFTSVYCCVARVRVPIS